MMIFLLGVAAGVAIGWSSKSPKWFEDAKKDVFGEW